jgi:hypothetical protein
MYHSSSEGNLPYREKMVILSCHFTLHLNKI